MKVAFLGDIALIGSYSILRNQNVIKDSFWGVKTLLSSCDYVVGNLETPFSYREKKNGAKSAYLYTEPENIEVLKILGVNAVTIANNHMFDYGREGYELTKQLLDEAGIAWFGAEGREVKIEIDGSRLAFSGWCCYSTNPQGCVKNGGYGLNEFDVSEAVKVLKRNADDGWLNIAAVHAGIEHVNFPSVDTIKVSEILAKTGPMIYYGHHPHVAQPVKREGESLIAYSLGNFCFDDIYAAQKDKSPLVKLSEDNRSSFVMIVDIDNNAIKGYQIVPIYIDKKGIEVGRGVSEEILDGFLQKMITLDIDAYEELRNEQRKAWVAPRKAKRNLKWVLKRVRPLYVRLMVTNKRNIKLYNRHIKSNL